MSRTGEAVFLPTLDEAQLRAFAPDEEYVRIVREVGATSVVCVPLANRGRVLGVLTLGMGRSGRSHEPADVSLLEELGRRAGVALDNARLYQETEEARRRAKLVLEAIPQMVWVTDAQGAATYVNARWVEYTGLSASEAIGWGEAMHPDDLEQLLPVWNRALDAGEPYEREVRIRRFSTGEYRWHLLRAVPLSDSAGRVTDWLGTTTDVDDRKRSEEVARFLDEASALLGSSLDLEETLRRFAELAVPRMADGCAVFLAEGEAVRQVAVARSEQAQRFPPSAGALHRALKVIETGQAELLAELPDTGTDGTEDGREVREPGMRSAIYVPLLARGKPLGAIGFVSCAANRRYSLGDLALSRELASRAAQAVDNAQLYREAQEAIRVRDDFLSVASHELKTPLTPLQLCLQSLQRSAQRCARGQLEPAQLEAKITSSIRQVGRIERLVDSLLDISRITGRRLELDLERLDLASLAQEVLARFEDQARTAGCELVVHASEPVWGQWDRLRLDQVLSNLLGNAVKFGLGRPIEVIVEGAPSRARLVVADQGIGIAPEDQRRIFERFERAVASKHYGGFGLGLWIVRQIVESMGGSIRVESAVGRGSRFEVELPITEP